MKALERFAGPIYAALRFVAGGLFLCHGAQKLFGVLGGSVADQPLFQAAGVIELVGGAMIALGFLTSWAAFLASGEMAVAYFYVHAPGGPWPIQNKGELAIVYSFLFLYFAARGSGGFSIDRLRSKRR